MNLPILFLNLTLVIAAGLLAYLHRQETLGAGGPDHVRVQELRLRQESIRAAVAQARADVHQAMRSCLLGTARVRHLAGSRPLQNWRAKWEQLAALVPLFRSENLAARMLPAGSVPAFQLPGSLAPADIDGDAPLALPEELEPMERELARLSSRYETLGFMAPTTTRHAEELHA
jgi:hypothetical protein